MCLDRPTDPMTVWAVGVFFRHLTEETPHLSVSQEQAMVTASFVMRIDFAVMHSTSRKVPSPDLRERRVLSHQCSIVTMPQSINFRPAPRVTCCSRTSPGCRSRTFTPSTCLSTSPLAWRAAPRARSSASCGSPGGSQRRRHSLLRSGRQLASCNFRLRAKTQAAAFVLFSSSTV